MPITSRWVRYGAVFFLETSSVAKGFKVQRTSLVEREKLLCTGHCGQDPQCLGSQSETCHPNSGPRPTLSDSVATLVLVLVLSLLKPLLPQIDLTRHGLCEPSYSGITTVFGLGGGTPNLEDTSERWEINPGSQTHDLLTDLVLFIPVFMCKKTHWAWMTGILISSLGRPWWSWPKS